LTLADTPTLPAGNYGIACWVDGGGGGSPDGVLSRDDLVGFVRSAAVPSNAALSITLDKP